LIEIRVVNLNLPKESIMEGRSYQGALRSYFRRVVAPEIAAGRPVEITTPALRGYQIPASPTHRYGSTMDLVRFRQERGIRVGGLLRRPEAIAEVVAPVPGTRERQVTEVHAIEATLDVNFSFGKEGVASHKRLQFPGTLWALAERYKNQPNVRFVYRFFSPWMPPESTKKYIEDEVKRQKISNLRIIWTVAR
jgi:hypothetical protein